MWFNAPSGTAGNAITFTQAMTLDASGNLLVGATSTLTGGSRKAVTINSAAGQLSILEFGVNGSLAGYMYANTTQMTLDSNTSPLTFITNASERMRIDSSGNVGIGTTTINARLHVTEDNKVFDGYGNVNVFSSTATATDAGGAIALGGRNSQGTDPFVFGKIKGAKEAGGTWNGYLAFGTTASSSAVTERMRIDSSGNVGIGTASPSFPLDVVSNSSSNAIQVRGRSSDNVSRVEFRSNNAATHFGTLVGYSNYMAIEAAQASGIIAFNTNSSERMRIDSSGNLQLGVTNGDARFNVTANGGSLDVMKWTDTRTGATSSNMAVIVRNGSVVGTIRTTDVATAYNTSSDYRLKENIAPMTGALAKVAQIKPCTYTWKLNGSEGQGFIAHELAEVIPQAVSGEKDAIDKNGNPEYQGIDTSFLVATLTAAIQEQQTLINNLTTRLNALEGK